MENVNLVELKNNLELQLKDTEIFNTLLTTTFKGLTAPVAKQAMLEGVMRGFTFKDFLEKNIYAVPFSSGYSLITSIDYARKIGMKSGVIGKSAPSYEEKDGKIISCSITIKKLVNEHIGDFTATVYFNEYTTGRNQWASKPRTMIAKVAEMHALRMACPEELSQSYVEEENEIQETPLNLEEHIQKLEACTNLDNLKTVWSSLPAQAKKELEAKKDEMKNKLEAQQKAIVGELATAIGGEVIE
jgi:hypothetical protein